MWYDLYNNILMNLRYLNKVPLCEAKLTNAKYFTFQSN